MCMTVSCRAAANWVYPALTINSEITRVLESASEQSVNPGESELNHEVEEFHPAPMELGESDAALQNCSGKGSSNDLPVKKTGILINEDHSSFHSSCADIDPVTGSDTELLKEVIDLIQEQNQTEKPGLSDGKEESSGD